LYICLDPELSESQVMYAKEKARNIAQRLLDWRVITDIEGETVLGRKYTLNGCTFKPPWLVNPYKCCEMFLVFMYV